MTMMMNYCSRSTITRHTEPAINEAHSSPRNTYWLTMRRKYIKSKMVEIKHGKHIEDSNQNKKYLVKPGSIAEAKIPTIN